eukprot:352845-Chlamydomonas_euryale.AAC.1
MRPKGSKSCPKAKDALPKYTEGRRGAAEKTRETMLLAEAKFVEKGMDVIPEGHDTPTLSTLEARAGPHEKCSKHRIG